VPVRRGPSGAWQVMVVQSRWTPTIWLFPKGGVEPGENAKGAATRETCEEAGVAGVLGPKLGSWRFTKALEQKHKMWLLFVTEEYGSADRRWKERKKRRREWLGLEACRLRIGDGLLDQEQRRPELMEMLDRTVAILAEVAGDGREWKRDLAMKAILSAAEDEESDDQDEDARVLGDGL
jgi:8-oxo-dGTP pyrophosphatase MutT (NUDIX family)